MDLKKFKEKSKATGKSELELYFDARIQELRDLFNASVPNLQRKALKYTVACGEHTTEGGDATEEILVDGMKSTDTAVVSLRKPGASPVTMSEYEVQDGKIVVTMSGDPSTDHELSFIVCRCLKK